MGNKALCANCGRQIVRNGKGGVWYHRHSISSACWPGNRVRTGKYGREATPVEVTSEPAP